VRLNRAKALCGGDVTVGEVAATGVFYRKGSGTTLSVRTTKSRTARILAAGVVAWLAVCFVAASAGASTVVATLATRATQGATAKSITVSGAVHNAGGEPIAGADVYLADEKNTTRAHAVSADDGSFKLSVERGGKYTVRAEKHGWGGDQSDPIELPRDANKRIELVMENSRNEGANAGAGTTATNTNAGKNAAAANGVDKADGIEFSDEPNFTVAGITDRSNLGLHGSDTTARTSDALARETLGLKSEDAEKRANADAAAMKKYQLAIAAESKGDFAAARDLTQKILAGGDDAEGHHLLGDIDERANDPLGAVREYERAARMYASEQNYFDWGAELLLHKAEQPAAEVFGKGVSLHPQSARMLAGLGAAQYAVRSYEDAARSLCKAADLQPGDAAAYLFLGQMEKTVAGPLACAEEKLAEFAREQPANAVANYYYAISLMKRGKQERGSGDLRAAQTLLEKAVTLKPDFGEAFVQLGVLEAERGDSVSAIRNYQKAVAVNPKLSDAHYRLSLALKRSGDEAGAKRELAAYQEAQKNESAEAELQGRALKQFMVVLKNSAGTK
jgi:tetratricopeptide (TPR) repeat protein